MSSENKCVTKSTHRGFLIRRQHKSTAEQEKALRDQLHMEIENKTKACSNIVYECSLPRIDGYEYCMRHILQDPEAPYNQCVYLYPNNSKRCTHAAPKYDPKKDVFTNLCFEHSRLTQLSKTRSSIGKFRAADNNDTILSNLAHHVSLDGEAAGTSANTSTYNDSSESDVDITKPVIKASIDIDSVKKREPIRNLLDYASDSSSNEDMPSLGNTWKNCDAECSDNESIDSQSEDLLKHAGGIFTTEEVVRITQQKMQRLQELYVDQVYRLQHLLREKRRKYLHSVRTEKETLCSIYDQTKDTPSERHLYQKLKALNKYHKRTGTEAILHRKFMEKRQKATDGVTQRTFFLHKCIYTEGGVKCGDRIIPCTKYCRKHILEDKRQILYRPCDIEKIGIKCQEPVFNIFENATCVLHIELQPQREYTQKKCETDSEDDDLPLIQHQQSLKLMKSEEEQLEIKTEDIEVFSTEEDIGTNVTICHDDNNSITGESSPLLIDAEPQPPPMSSSTSSEVVTTSDVIVADLLPPATITSTSITTTPDPV